MKNAIFALFLIIGCASESAPEIPDVAGKYAEINSNEGLAYTRFCYDAAGCGFAAARLLEQFVGSEESAKTGITHPFRCDGHDGSTGARCFDNAGHIDAYVRDCAQTAKDAWTCEFGVGTHTSGLGDQPLGTVHLLTPTFRFDFWDGARGVADAVSHTFVYDTGTKQGYLPSR